MIENSPVKGLMTYEFYSASKNIVIFLAMTLGVNLTTLIAGVPSFFALSVLFGILILPSAFMGNVARDTFTKWDKLQLTMPIKRKNVIVSKYLIYFLAVLVGIIFTGICAGISSCLHERLLSYVLDYMFIWMPFSIGASFLACGIFYPIVYTIGDNKEEAIMFISIFGAIGFMFLIYTAGFAWGFSQEIVAAVCVAFSVVIFAISFFITVKIYAKKDI